MDVFTTATAAIELIETIHKVIGMIKSIRHAREKADVLCIELEILDSNLRGVQKISGRGSDPIFTQNSILVAGADACGRKLKKLLDELGKVQRSRTERLKWSLKEEHYREILQEVRALSSILHFAISLDTIQLLTKSVEDATDALQLQMKSLDVLTSLNGTMERVERKIDQGFTDWKKAQALRRRDQICTAIDQRSTSSSCTNQEVRHNRIRQMKSEHTLSWFLIDPSFERWLGSRQRPDIGRNYPNDSSDPEETTDAFQSLWRPPSGFSRSYERVFLCQGFPGSGKSTLVSTVIDFLRQAAKDTGDGLVYFYIDYKDEQDRLEYDLILCFLQQILHTVESTGDQLCKTLEWLENALLGPSGPSLENIRSILNDVFRAYDTVYVVLDALDEVHTSNRRAVLSFLSELTGSLNVKIFLTSRHISDLKQAFPFSVSYEFRALNEDIGQYLRGEIAKIDRFDSDPVDDRVKEHIVAEIVSIADGMFLLSKLLLQSVFDAVSAGDRLDALSMMPKDLPSFFRKTLKRISKQTPPLKTTAEDIFLWIIHSKTLLTVQQMREALSIDLNGRPLSSDYWPPLSIILNCCQGFVQVGVGDRLLFIHKAVYDFLREEMAPDWNHRLALLSISYIKDPAFSKGPITDPATHLESHPFLEYLSHGWMMHLKQDFNAISSHWLDLFSRYKPNVFFVHQYSYWSQGYQQRYYTIDEAWSVTPLMLACKAGVPELVALLLDAHPSMRNQGTATVGTTPLIMAASAGQLEIVSLLKEKGANLYKENRYGNALHCAAEAGMTRMCQRLVEMGLNPNRRSRQGSGKSPLACAINRDQVETFQTLIQLGAEPSSVHFSTTFANRSTAIMKYLLGKGISSFDERAPPKRTLRERVFGPGKGLRKVALEY